MSLRDPKGSFIGTIVTCQRSLGLAPTDRNMLESQTIDELSQMAEQLQATVARRLGNKQ